MTTKKPEINFKDDDNTIGVNVSPVTKKKVIYKGIFEC